jgi:hypothetical protein
MALASVLLNTTTYGNDYVSEAPGLNLTSGVLVSQWYKMPDPGATWSRGNDNILDFVGSNWHIRCIAGNSSYDGASAFYNANTMFFVDPGSVYIGDSSYYQSSANEITAAQIKDWHWCAWQLSMDSTSFTIRQWLKFGLTEAVMGPWSSNVLFSDIRAALVAAGWTTAAANAWVPSTTLSTVRFGYDS